MKRTALLLTFLFSFAAAMLQAQSYQYLHFDRVDDYVRLDSGSQFITNTSAFSMAGWFYTDQLAYGQGMMGFRGANEGFYLIQLNNGTLECRLLTSTGLHQYIAPNFTIIPGSWQHIAWVYNGSTVSLYIGGQLRGSASASGQLTDDDVSFTVGRSILGNLNFYFGGRADEVSVWDKALTTTDLQDMMANELTGSEPNLQLYYKFNQGLPGGDNTTIDKLVCELGGGARDADILNFTLNGPTSNFGGVQQVGFQSIAFPEVDNQLVNNAPFVLQATASSGLPVSYSVVSGPATVSGDTLTLTGTHGEVVLMASQAGDGTYTAAKDVTKSFYAVDPFVSIPNVELRNPRSGPVPVPTLSELQLAAIVDTDFPELLSVKEVEFEVDGDVITAFDWNNEHYTGWWASPTYGMHSVTIRATNNFGAVSTETLTIDVVNSATNKASNALNNVHVTGYTYVEEFEVELPSFLGAYDQVMGNLALTCPAGGCDPWDLITKIEVKNHEGNWIEVIRYITPYGLACNSTMDLTDFMSALQGKVTFRLSSGASGPGYLYTLNLVYQAGSPQYMYSHITPVWQETFDFGDFANLQPVPAKNVTFPRNTAAAKFKLISTGHGWGDNNTSNAAEFFNTTHHIWVNGNQTFTQNNWLTCNPNPDNCQPQNGTWFYNRAGWCPGASSPWFDFDLNTYVPNGSLELDYVFDENYVDFCHANHPNCVTGVTCDNCNDGFNPHLIVASTVISYSNNVMTSLEDEVLENFFSLYPNPSSGIIDIELEKPVKSADLKVINTIGVEVASFDQVDFLDKRHTLSLGHLPSGMYIVILETDKGRGMKKFNLVR